MAESKEGAGMLKHALKHPFKTLTSLEWGPTRIAVLEVAMLTALITALITALNSLKRVRSKYSFHNIELLKYL
jgi:hypothetical protein